MAISLSIYSNANAKSKTVSVDFSAGVLADSESGVSSEVQYYMKFSTQAKTALNKALPVKIGKGLNDLALLGNVQSAANVSADYVDIKSMIVDYAYDYIYGHTANQWGTGVTKQDPIDFSR